MTEKDFETLKSYDNMKNYAINYGKNDVISGFWDLISHQSKNNGIMTEIYGIDENRIHDLLEYGEMVKFEDDAFWIMDKYGKQNFGFKWEEIHFRFISNGQM